MLNFYHPFILFTLLKKKLLNARMYWHHGICFFLPFLSNTLTCCVLVLAFEFVLCCIDPFFSNLAVPILIGVPILFLLLLTQTIFADWSGC